MTGEVDGSKKKQALHMLCDESIFTGTASKEKVAANLQRLANGDFLSALNSGALQPVCVSCRINTDYLINRVSGAADG